MLERKVFALSRVEFKAGDDGPGEMAGYGSTTGNVDEGGDVILPGAFKDALPAFLERGFVPVSHNWMDLPVATIEDAREDDVGLFFRAMFHSTQAAQDARTVVRERIDRGKFVGLSIGFLPDYDAITFRDDGVRVIPKIKDLAEISIVTVPMNRQAGITDAKDGLGAGLSYEDHGQRVLADLASFAARTRERSDYRAKEGRVLSGANRTRLASIADGMETGVVDLRSILVDTDPDKEKGTPADLFRWRARLHEVSLVLAEA